MALLTFCLIFFFFFTPLSRFKCRERKKGSMLSPHSGMSFIQCFARHEYIAGYYWYSLISILSFCSNRTMEGPYSLMDKFSPIKIWVEIRYATCKPSGLFPNCFLLSHWWRANKDLDVRISGWKDVRFLHHHMLTTLLARTKYLFSLSCCMLKSDTAV